MEGRKIVQCVQGRGLIGPMVCVQCGFGALVACMLSKCTGLDKRQIAFGVQGYRPLPTLHTAVMNEGDVQTQALFSCSTGIIIVAICGPVAS
jgi:hypothetical protein